MKLPRESLFLTAAHMHLALKHILSAFAIHFFLLKTGLLLSFYVSERHAFDILSYQQPPYICQLQVFAGRNSPFPLVK